MIDLHLLWKVFFEPVILLDVVVDELEGQLPVYLYGIFALLAVVEPCLCPPPESRTVGIDAHDALDVETLDVYLQVCQRINEIARRYGIVVCFFFSSALSELRNMW